MAGKYSNAEHAIRSEFGVHELIVKVHSSCYGVSRRSQASYSDEMLSDQKSEFMSRLESSFRLKKKPVVKVPLSFG